MIVILFKGCSFDIIFLDYVMNIIHGPETASILRNNLNYKG